MITYIIIALLSVLLIMAFISLEKEKRIKCDLILKLEAENSLVIRLSKEYSNKIADLNKRTQELIDKDNACANRLDDVCNERNHYKNKCDSLTKEVNSLKSRLSRLTDSNSLLTKEKDELLRKISGLEEQLLFANGTSTTASEPEPEQVPDPEAEPVNQPTTKVRKPHRPRARANKQAR